MKLIGNKPVTRYSVTRALLTTMSHYLSLKNVSKTYDDGKQLNQVLQSVSLTMAAGEQVALLGQSGCGKSTLLNIIAGIDRLDQGEVHVADIALHNLSEKDLTLFRRQHIGFIYQSFNLIPTLTAIENVQIPLHLNGFKPADALEKARTMLERVGLSGRIEAFPDQLSGGEQQRVAIARGMIHSPALVLADEHTGNLDAATGRDMQTLFNEIARDTKQTVLMVTHSEAVAEAADRVIEMIDGRIDHHSNVVVKQADQSNANNNDRHSQ